MIKLSNTAV